MVRLKVRNPDQLKYDIVMAGLSISQLARDIGISKSHLSSVINGRNNTSGVTAGHIINAIRTVDQRYSIKDIFFEVGVEKSQHKSLAK